MLETIREYAAERLEDSGELADPRPRHAEPLMAIDSGDALTAKLRVEEAFALYCELGDAWCAANSRFLLGHALADQADLERAQQLFAESVRRFTELGDEHYTLLATHGLAWTLE